MHSTAQRRGSPGISHFTLASSPVRTDSPRLQPTPELFRHICCGFSSAGSRRSTTMASGVGSVGFISCRLTPATAKPMGISRPSVSRLRLGPDLHRSVDWDRFLLPQRGLGYHPVHRLLFPIQADLIIVPSTPACHILEDACFLPFLKPTVDGAGGAETAWQGCPLAPGPQHAEGRSLPDDYPSGGAQASFSLWVAGAEALSAPTDRQESGKFHWPSRSLLAVMVTPSIPHFPFFG